MKLTVEMLAFGEPGETRVLEVPDDELPGDSMRQLEKIFRYLQDAPGLASISIGDVIHFGADRFLVAGAGFRLLPETEYREYLAISRIERLVYVTAVGPPLRLLF